MKSTLPETLTDYSWNRLYQFMESRVPLYASHIHRTGLAKLNFSAHRAPEFNELRDKFAKQTRWELVAVEGDLPGETFLSMIGKGQFPIGTKMRSLNQLYGSIQADMWHECFGHLPVLMDERVSDLYEWVGFQSLQLLAAGEHSRFEELAQLYWFLMEYGLILESGQKKVFGAGLIASPLGLQRWVSGQIKDFRFQPQRVLRYEYDPHVFQKHLFVMASIEDTGKKLRAWLDERV